jgi:hypothetical protein
MPPSLFDREEWLRYRDASQIAEELDDARSWLAFNTPQELREYCQSYPLHRHQAPLVRGLALDENWPF